jgi:hypothetical protein
MADSEALLRLLALFAASMGLCAAQDAREIVERSISLDKRFSEAVLDYAYVQHVEQRDLDSKGAAKRVTSRDYEVMLIEGTPYMRLVRRNGKPLAPDEEREQRQRLEQVIAGRKNESPAERAARLEDWKRREQRRRAPLREIPAAFHLRLAGETRLDGRELYVIQATPRPGYTGKDRISRAFPKLKGSLWIDKHTYEWVRAEAEVLETVSYGLFLIRVLPGTKLAIEETYVDGEVWLPSFFKADGTVRLGLIKRMRLQYEIDFREYRKAGKD